MKMFRNFGMLSGLFLMTLLLFTAGCKKETEPAPDLPPQSSFIMDFSAFSNPDDTLGSREMTTYNNWGYAYTNVVVWNALLTVGLAVPVATFVEAFNHEAVYHPDQSNWTWSYNVTVGMVVYEAELTGYLEADSVVWEMRITAGNEYNDFLWYHGKSALMPDQPGGFWMLRENPANPNDLLRIDWQNSGNGIASISYTNVRPGDPENGGYIYYGTTSGYFDRLYHIYNKGKDNLTEIEWSAGNQDGRIKDLFHFGDGLWHCWDTNLMDVECP